jgi:hypothetical protein
MFRLSFIGLSLLTNCVKTAHGSLISVVDVSFSLTSGLCDEYNTADP